MQLKVTQIETANGIKDGKPWTRYDVTGANDKGKQIIASTFDTIDFQQGDMLDADIVMSGQYSKLKSYKIIQQGKQPATTLTKPTTQNRPVNQPNPTRIPPQPISWAEKGLTLKEIGDNFRSGFWTIGTQPDVYEFYRSEISRVSGVKVN